MTIVNAQAKRSISKTDRPHLSEGDIVLNDYEILKVLHNGSMSNVYLVKDINLGTLWVLKEALKDGSSAGKVRYDSIIREANIIKALNHDGVPRIVTMKEFEDRTLILMDFVEGYSLQQLIAQNGKLNTELTLNLMLQLAAVMSYLHKKKLIYRDLKPDNVMVEHGKVKLLDFGISEVVRPDNQVIKENLGTRGYAAPEQHKIGSRYDFRSDIYSFGATMFHVLTGVHPYNFQTYVKETSKGKVRRPDRTIPLNVRDLVPGISESLAEFILKCTKIDPEERFQSFEEVIYGLQNYTKIDSKQMKIYRDKIRTLIGLGVIGVVVVGSSLIPFSLEGRNIDKNFMQQISVARQTDNEEDWVKALNIKGNDIEALNGYLESTKTDGEFSPDEQKNLLKYVTPSLNELKQEKGYNELAYNIGQTYWFYTDTPEDRLMSLTWFEDAVKYKSENSDKANIMHSIGSFEKNISGAVRESKDAGLYEKYWANLMNVKQLTDKNNVGEILDLQLNYTIAKAIDQYVGGLKSDGVPKEQLVNEVHRLESFALSSSPSGDRSKQILKNLKQTLAGLNQKIDSVYYEPTNK